MDTDKGQSMVVEIHNRKVDRFGTRLEGSLQDGEELSFGYTDRAAETRSR
jgi:hypothetical protein